MRTVLLQFKWIKPSPLRSNESSVTNFISFFLILVRSLGSQIYFDGFYHFTYFWNANEFYFKHNFWKFYF